MRRSADAASGREADSEHRVIFPMNSWKKDTIRNWSPRAFLVFVLLIGGWEGSALFQHSGFRIRTESLRVRQPAASLSEGFPHAVPATGLAPEKILPAPRARIKRPDGPAPLLAPSGSAWPPGEPRSLGLPVPSPPASA